MERPRKKQRTLSHVFKEPGADFLAHLRHQGFAVLEETLGKESRDLFLREFWSAVGQVTPGVKEKDPTTWHMLPRGNKGLVSTNGLPQADFAWRVRQAPRVKAAFAAIFGTEDLVVSTDSIIVQARKQKSKRPSWLHKDQAPDLPRGFSVQAIYCCYSSGAEDAGTCLVPESHKSVHPWELELPQSDRDGNFLLAPNQRDYEAMKPDVPEDGIIFFDSRLLHANVDAKAARQDRLARLCVPVAMAPRSRRSESTKAKKVDLYLSGKASSHWPCDRFAAKRTPRWCHTKGSAHLPLPSADPGRLALL
ncbi:unnamed protein product [Symbiodinium natans]|uniref:Phytanoyl-CoA dioxygenase n=1 Tax=Symbiodinium natans TaxID=878477 RepID=A0A812T8S6_9DINO|nr:unnamed protein product [Symbiodinium natans]